MLGGCSSTAVQAVVRGGINTVPTLAIDAVPSARCRVLVAEGKVFARGWVAVTSGDHDVSRC